MALVEQLQDRPSGLQEAHSIYVQGDVRINGVIVDIKERSGVVGFKFKGRHEKARFSREGFLLNGVAVSKDVPLTENLAVGDIVNLANLREMRCEPEEKLGINFHTEIIVIDAVETTGTVVEVTKYKEKKIPHVVEAMINNKVERIFIPFANVLVNRKHVSLCKLTEWSSFEIGREVIVEISLERRNAEVNCEFEGVVHIASIDPSPINVGECTNVSKSLSYCSDAKKEPTRRNEDFPLPKESILSSAKVVNLPPPVSSARSTAAATSAGPLIFFDASPSKEKQSTTSFKTSLPAFSKLTPSLASATAENGPLIFFETSHSKEKQTSFKTGIPAFSKLPLPATATVTAQNSTGANGPLIFFETSHSKEKQTSFKTGLPAFSKLPPPATATVTAQNSTTRANGPLIFFGSNDESNLSSSRRLHPENLPPPSASTLPSRKGQPKDNFARSNQKKTSSKENKTQEITSRGSKVMSSQGTQTVSTGDIVAFGIYPGV